MKRNARGDTSVTPSTPAPQRLDILWGAKAIARYLGRGVDFVYSLRDDPFTPIRKKRGQLYAFRSDLEAWLRAEETTPPR